IKDGLKEFKLTSFNDSLLSQLKLSKPEKFSFKASDGVLVEGWIMKPSTNYEGKVPTILYIHGGPKTAYGASFIHEFHLITANGYALVYLNPRGSDGYSEEFADIRGHYGERDFKDIMEGLDYVIRNFDFIDESKLGVIGGSYGGFMVNWIVGHTDRFKAAVSMRGICNWYSFYGVSDIGYWFILDHILGGLDRKPLTREGIAKMIEKSPLTYSENVNTPLLIIHSINDLRCYYEQALQFFTALKWLGKDVKLVLVPKETHDLSRTGKPKHRIERLKHIIEWFNEKLKEEKAK
ncbi:MAG TPA: S9 family peptidase, partial [Candidatus Atribacteria bacterium]|nr:S9 family peptidase [Candidatus Atribacteria bacterium]